MKKIYNLNNLLNLFFITIFLNYCFFLYRIISRSNPWIVGDWLTNYENGLVRRGLFGEIFLSLIEITNFEVLNTLFIVICLFVFIFYYFSLKIIKQSEINYLYLLIIISPATYLFTFYDPLTTGRKEILIFVFFSYYIYSIKNELSFSSINYNCLFFIIGICLVLTHEIIIFFMFFPLFIKFLLIEKHKKNNFICIKSEVSFIIGCIIGLVLLFLFSSSNDPNTPSIICQKIISFNLSENVCNGPVRETYLTETAFLNIINHTIFYIQNFNYFYYFYYFCLFLITIFFIFLFVEKPKQNRKIFLFFLFNIIQIIFLLVLFIIVNDWGRYLNIYFITISLVLIKFFSFNIKYNNIFAKTLILILIISNTTLWHMPHCCSKKFGNGFFSLKERIQIRLNTANNYDDKPRQILIYFLNKFNKKNY